MRLLQKIFYLLTIITLFYSCAQQKDRITIIYEPVKSLGKWEYKHLEKLYKDKKYSLYLKKSNAFVNKFSESAYASEIIYKRAYIYLNDQKYLVAVKEFKKGIVSYPNSSYKNMSLYYSAISNYKLNDINQAFLDIDRMDVSSNDIEKDIKVKAHWLKGNIQSSLNKLSDAASTFIELYNSTDDEQIKSKIFVSVLTFINDMSLDELEDLSSSGEGLWEPYFKFELGERYLKLGQNSNARNLFRDILEDYPEHEYRTQAENNLRKLENLDKVSPYTIGVVLPLSGKYAPFGLRSLRGIQLAADIVGLQNTTKNMPIRLAIMDSKSDTDVAKLSVDRLIAEDNVIGILGSLRSETSEAVAEYSSLAGIPNISLSQNKNITKKSEYIFSIAMSNKNQIRRLVSYATKQLAIKRFGILYPNDYYGQEYMKLFWDEVISNDGKITAIESYNVKEKDFSEQIKKLLGLYYMEPRITEYNELKELKEAELGREVRAKEVELSGILAFDAMFVPDDARTVAQIAPYLAFYDVENIILMGPNTWHSSQLIKRGKEHVEGAVFVDDFYVNSPLDEVKEFVNIFRKNFQVKPGILEAQAFDATNIMISSLNKILENEGEFSLNREKLMSYIKEIKIIKA